MEEKSRDYQLLQRPVAESLDIYNSVSPRLSCGMQYQVDFHEK